MLMWHSCGCDETCLCSPPMVLQVEESQSGSELLDLSKARNPEVSEPEQQLLKLKEEPEKVDPVLVEESVKEHPLVPQRINEEPEVPRLPTPPTQALLKVSWNALPLMQGHYSHAE